MILFAPHRARRLVMLALYASAPHPMTSERVTVVIGGRWKRPVEVALRDAERLGWCINDGGSWYLTDNGASHVANEVA